MISVIVRLVLRALGKDRTYMVGPDWAIYFEDKNFLKRVPVVLHEPTKVVIRQPRKNAWLMSDWRLRRYATKVTADISYAENIDTIEPGDRAAGLLRIALASRKTKMEGIHQMGDKYFLADMAELQTSVTILRFVSYECMTVV